MDKTMRDATSLLRTATRRAKSDVANKLVSMFLHELSRRISQHWPIRVDGEEYERTVRTTFENACPYCRRPLTPGESIVEHLDGMNRYRIGLHVAGNVLMACKKCNSEKRRDDSARILLLGDSGWSSFLSHDGLHCAPECGTCRYWKSIWPADVERHQKLSENLQKIRAFRCSFPEFERSRTIAITALPHLLTKLYSDCQLFAETEIRSLIAHFEEIAVAKT